MNHIGKCCFNLPPFLLLPVPTQSYAAETTVCINKSLYLQLIPTYFDTASFHALDA